MEGILVKLCGASKLYQAEQPDTDKGKAFSERECYQAITQADKELEQLQKRKLERYEAYRSGEISRENFIKTKDQITLQISELQTKKEQLENQYRTLLQAKAAEEEKKSGLSQAEKIVADYDAGLKEHLYDVINRVIVTTNEHIEIEWVFADIFAQKED